MTPSDLDAAVNAYAPDNEHPVCRQERRAFKAGAAWREERDSVLQALRVEASDIRYKREEELTKERDQLKAETERLRCSFISRDEKDVQIEKLKAELRRLKELHEIRRENTQSELDRRAEIIYQANKEIGAYRAQCEKLAEALKSCYHNEHKPNYCKICDALAEYEAFKKGKADE